MCKADTLPERLQELSLSVLDDRECQQLSGGAKDSTIKVNIELELCAGKKNFIPQYPIYTRMVNGSKVKKSNCIKIVRI